MKIEQQGENLIFLISQPRSGSTMLQRILGGHPDIHTTSEPWLMLHPLYTLRPNGYTAEYDENLARIATLNFLQDCPHQQNEYFEGMRRMYGYLYNQILKTSSKHFYLDKTPRYYLVLPDLFQVFPEAHYIILLRNPLAVLCSVIKSWAENNLFSLYTWKNDLLQAPNLLINGIEQLGINGVVVHYEELLANPEDEVRRICKKLNLEMVPGIVDYGEHDLTQWQLGDQENIYKYSRPASENVDAWVESLEDSQTWRLARDYLQFLGVDRVKKMGYSYEELLQILQENKPTESAISFSFSLAWLLDKPYQDRNIGKQIYARFLRSIQVRGVFGTFTAIRKWFLLNLVQKSTSPNRSD